MKNRKSVFIIFAILLGVATFVTPVLARPGSGAAHNRVALPGTDLAAPAESPTGVYIILLNDPAVASYTGGIAGFDATSPQVAGGRKLDLASTASKTYVAYLESQQTSFINSMNAALGRSVKVNYQYLYALNGMAVEIGSDEAAVVAALPGVSLVQPEQVHYLDTDVGPKWIGADDIWNGNTAGGLDTQGEGIIVGVIDTGINSTHPSFADIGGDGYDHTNPYGPGNYVGVCDPGDPSFDPSFVCNDKLIGAWDMLGADPTDPTAPEDTNGHGSHTASTAAGNVISATLMYPVTTITRTISGVSPHSNIIAYDVCATNTCDDSAIVAGINQAVADGVDVINYSIGPNAPANPWVEPEELAFLGAYNAGVYVSESAGNAGPGFGTTVKNAPWVMNVAASTHSRIFANTVDVTGPGTVPGDLVGLAAIPGASVGIPSTIENDIIYSGDVDPSNINGCAAFPANSFLDAIALIQRGSCTFEQKVNNADAAGAIAVLMFNNVGGPPITMGFNNPVSIPNAMASLEDGNAIVAWIQGNSGPTLRINVDVSAVEDLAFGDIVAGFSSRGPGLFDIIQPNVTAPGVNILAAYCKDCPNPAEFALLQGTSMSSPHNAGAGALMMALHPNWSPSQIKSAIMSTSTSWENLVKEDAATQADPFDIGNGLVNLTDAAYVGFVQHITGAEFLAADPGTGGEPRDLNLASLADGSCNPGCSWTRTISSTMGVTVSWTTSVDNPAGVTLLVSPSSFDLGPYDTQVITVTADTSSAALDTWLFGNVNFAPVTRAGGAAPSNAHWAAAIKAAQPDIEVSPSSLSNSQLVGTVVTQTLTISNIGGTILDWDIDEDNSTSGLSPLRGPSSESITIGGAGLTGSGLSLDAVSGRDTPLLIPAGAITLTHSTSNSVVPGSVACNYDDPPGGASDNAYLRVFDLSTYGQITGPFQVTNVQFGVESATSVGGTQPLTINLYKTASEPLLYANMTLIGTANISLPDQSLTLVNVPVSGTAQPTDLLVVEIFQPDTGNTATNFFVGSNALGQSDESYLASAGCGINNPINIGAIGFPNMHVVMSVSGDVSGGAVACDAPEDIPWLSLSPTSGSTAAAGSDDVTVTYDSTGLAAGTYNAALCVNSNDPDESVVVVPVQLDVGGSLTAYLPVIMNKPPAAVSTLFNNGPLITIPGATPADPDISRLQSSSLGMCILGFGHSAATSLRMADDFTVGSANGWNVEKIVFYAYQTGSATASTMNFVSLRIWDGEPGNGGSVIWGDTTTNRILSSAWSNIYRDSETSPGATNRPVMASTIYIGEHLPQGTYWLDWNTGGSLASGPWAPPITIVGNNTTGNGLQFDGATWNAALDEGTGCGSLTPQGLPFMVVGNVGP